MAKALYLYNLNNGFLYRLTNPTKLKRLLSLYPNWRNLDEDEMEIVKNYFAKYGKIVASDGDETIRATY
jgi:hypothetical protein